MGWRQREWARRDRKRLMEELGGRCAHCGATENLEFDCIMPQGDFHHRIGSAERHSFYRYQHRHGNLQILCRACNAAKGDGTHVPEECRHAAAT